MKNKTLKIILSIVAIVIVAGLGSVFVSIGNPWFEALIKPSQWIPSFVIPVVWSIIYVAFGVLLILWLLKDTTFNIYSSHNQWGFKYSLVSCFLHPQTNLIGKHCYSIELDCRILVDF